LTTKPGVVVLQSATVSAFEAHPWILTLVPRAVTDELSQYDFELPDRLIAKHPTARRDEARLLVVDRSRGELLHRSIRDLPDLLRAPDALVVNDTRVVPARLVGCRGQTGGGWEGLFLEATDAGYWRLLGKTRGRLKPGERLVLTPPHVPGSPERLELELLDCDSDGIWTARPLASGDPLTLLDRFGTVPLPPYLRRTLAEPADFERYQTTYASRPGSVAAPTAGLHLTPEILDRCREKGIERHSVTLHVGIGTFRPITSPTLAGHRMHSEWCEVTPETARRIAESRSSGGRIVAVGTTSTRTLETAAPGGEEGWRGRTELFIHPPYRFQAVDALLTNFHLPRSTLLVLVSTFAGRELIRHAYETAIREEYRFFSYGDAMLVV
jgi:S-adenosylmethionine:tRNA ribosyltransferase-isomerase